MRTLSLLALATAAACPPAQEPASQARDLESVTFPPYQTFCSACHGASGRGDGPMAALLDPKPRDFTQALFALASTENGVPSDDDLLSTVGNGVPGAAMPALSGLPRGPQRMAVRSVRNLSRLGKRQHVQAAARDEGVELSPAEIDGIVADWTTPGPPVVLPNLAAHRYDRAHGREIYMTSCASCHGPGGRGDGQANVLDARGQVVLARDFTGGVLKGGATLRDLYLRLRVGMPFSSMPALARAQATDGDVLDVVAFVRSLLPEDRAAGAGADGARVARFLGHTQPGSTVARRVERLPASPDAAAWSELPASTLSRQALQARRVAPADLELRAAHDGQRLAVRLAFADPTAGSAPGGDLVMLQVSRRAMPTYFLETRYPDRALANLGPAWFADGAGRVAALPPVHPRVLDELPRAFGAKGAVKAAVAWSEGRWLVVFERDLAASEPELPLRSGDSILVHAMTWDDPGSFGYQLARFSPWWRVAIE